MENFNSKEFQREIHSLYLPGRRTVLPLLVLLGKDTLFKSPFAFDLHSFGDWFFRVLALNGCTLAHGSGSLLVLRIWWQAMVFAY